MKKLMLLFLTLSFSIGLKAQIKFIFNPSDSSIIVQGGYYIIQYHSLSSGNQTIVNNIISMINSVAIPLPTHLAQINYAAGSFTLLGDNGLYVSKAESALTGVQKLRCDSAIAALNLTTLSSIVGTNSFIANGTVMNFDSVDNQSGGLLSRVLVTLTNILNGITIY